MFRQRSPARSPELDLLQSYVDCLWVSGALRRKAPALACAAHMACTAGRSLWPQVTSTLQSAEYVHGKWLYRRATFSANLRMPSTRRKSGTLSVLNKPEPAAGPPLPLGRHRGTASGRDGRVSTVFTSGVRHVRGPSVETELVALDVLHHDARLVDAIGKQ
jgi:hypothetical protein